jgi:hypothetical protein
MSTLEQIESGLQAYVLGTGSDVTVTIAGRDDAYRAQRLDIYRDAYRLRLAEVLASDFPALRAHVGEAAFDAIAFEYLAAHPSTFRNVRWFGGALARFLREQPDHASEPARAELAQFEWALGLAFDAPDQPAVAFADVVALAPEAWPELRLQAHPCLHLVKLQTNAVAIWNAHNAGGAPVPATTLDAPVDWAIWRKDLSPYFRSLPADEAWALVAMRDGSSFGEICAGLCDWVPEEQAALRAAQLLRGWVDETWIAGLNVA